ncbi:MAG TPA: sulfatase-like hydrolase/transferase, partial [Terriglobales bacterium]|nr:sulfatase-like hydrolase/transferase [Terriglobales bacterium]
MAQPVANVPGAQPAVAPQGTTKKSARWRDLACALSLANLSFLRVWAELLDDDRTYTFWLKTPATPAHFAALMINILILSALIFVAFRLGRRSGKAVRKLIPILFLIVLAILVNNLQELIASPDRSVIFRIAYQEAMIIGVGIGIVFVIAYMISGTRVLRLVLTLLLLLFPFVPVTFARAIWRMTHYDPSAFADGTLARPFPGLAARRVVWVIFDEWDQQLTFPDRDASVRLPQIDRFRNSAFHAENVYEAGRFTGMSMAGLTSGHMVKGIRTLGPRDLTLEFSDSPSAIDWSKQQTVFSRARALGLNTAAVAWWIPYCRILNESLTACEWWAGSNQYNSTGRRLGEILVNQIRSLMETPARSPFGQSLCTQRHAHMYGEMLGSAEAMVNRRDIGLLLLHMPIPHKPYIYERERGDLSYRSTPILSFFDRRRTAYLGALELVDSTVGEIRRSMEQAGTWDDTTILLSSDHGLRSPRPDGK